MTNMVKIVTFVPIDHAEVVRQARGRAGGGQIGEYSFCSYSVTGKGRFLPFEAAHPHIGAANRLETVEEERTELICPRDIATQVLAALRRVHAHEEVAIDILPLVNEDDL